MSSCVGVNIFGSSSPVRVFIPRYVLVDPQQPQQPPAQPQQGLQVRGLGSGTASVHQALALGSLIPVAYLTVIVFDFHVRSSRPGRAPPSLFLVHSLFAVISLCPPTPTPSTDCLAPAHPGIVLVPLISPHFQNGPDCPSTPGGGSSSGHHRPYYAYRVEASLGGGARFVRVERRYSQFLALHNEVRGKKGDIQCVNVIRWHRCTVRCTM